MNRTNVRKLIKSIRNGSFHFGNQKLCVYGHILAIDSHNAHGRDASHVIAEFLGMDSTAAFHLYIGEDADGNDLTEDTFGHSTTENSPVQKKAVLKYLRQYS